MTTYLILQRDSMYLFMKLYSQTVQLRVHYRLWILDISNIYIYVLLDTYYT